MATSEPSSEIEGFGPRRFAWRSCGGLEPGFSCQNEVRATEAHRPARRQQETRAVGRRLEALARIRRTAGLSALQQFELTLQIDTRRGDRRHQFNPFTGSALAFLERGIDPGAPSHAILSREIPRGRPARRKAGSRASRSRVTVPRLPRRACAAKPYLC